MTTKHALKKVALLYPLYGVRPPDDVNDETQRSLTGRWKTELLDFFRRIPAETARKLLHYMYIANGASILYPHLGTSEA